MQFLGSAWRGLASEALRCIWNFSGGYLNYHDRFPQGCSDLREVWHRHEPVARVLSAFSCSASVEIESKRFVQEPFFTASPAVHPGYDSRKPDRGRRRERGR
jgi:hypothetical protein